MLQSTADCFVRSVAAMIKGMKNRESLNKTPYGGSITDVAGIAVGHAQKTRTGCTVVLCGPGGAVAGVDVRGAAPGTRETDLLGPSNLIERVHAIVLTGGSVFGLDAACGVARYLEERDIGFETGSARVPIVPAAVLYDLAVAEPGVRPDHSTGYEACKSASTGPVREGRVGAGAGSTVGKVLGSAMASPGGVGTASATLSSGITVGVLVVVNAFGDIVEPESGRILAGARSPDGSGWLDTPSALRKGLPVVASTVESTTLAVVATDAALTRAQARRLAIMAHDGLARAIRPVHTMYDGDTVFALSTGGGRADLTAIGSVAVDLVAGAVVRVGLASGSAAPPLRGDGLLNGA